MKIIYYHGCTICLLLGIIIGGLSGIIFGEKTDIVQPIGDFFLHLIFSTIVPFVFFSISSSIAKMKKITRLRKILQTIFIVFFSTAVFSAIVSFIITIIYNPFQRLDLKNLIVNMPPLKHLQNNNIGEIIVNTFTVSDFPYLFTKDNLLPMMFFSVLLGLATSVSGEKGKPVAALLTSSTIVILRIIKIIMYIAPVGLGCYFAATIGHSGTQIIHDYLNVLFLYLILTILYFFGVNTLYSFIAGGKLGIKIFWSNIMIPTLTAISTSSSVACIPVNLIATKKIGVPNDIAETVVCLGANIHKDGSVIGGIIKIIFLFTLFHRDMNDFINIIAIIIVALLVGAVMGAIPSGGMTGELIICSIFNFPSELIGSILIISAIIDIPATLLNSTGNTVCAMMVTRIIEGKHWLQKKM
ncbi:C4-dicarboxylate transport protein [Candidatus Profftia lariciata]|uniref:dicarboxylate/amino acid:cation symporter n=1 Tax=Candidatus Profftia lariciata TaxID=1987921 RepID=UPI001D01A7A0|nr:cation:dicarboxylase symporter family transporter [Candidatus Profftia lariciata]UDG81797.1 C4-dicarboxylate transport protein [Candidatus Profftia lariciata]